MFVWYSVEKEVSKKQVCFLLYIITSQPGLLAAVRTEIFYIIYIKKKYIYI